MMTARKRIVSLIGASLFVASMAFAATPPPPAAEIPTVLWVYYAAPAPGWYIFDKFANGEACTKALATVKATPLQEDEGCFWLGMDPNHLHPDYVVTTKPPPAK